MGIDVYLNWKGQTQAEKEAQYTGFSVIHGHVGYLREAYHGGPYATKVLISELWDDQPKEGFRITAAELRRRLSAALKAANERSRRIYNEELADDDPVLQSFRDFVALAEKLEAEGKELRVIVSY